MISEVSGKLVTQQTPIVPGDVLVSVQGGPFESRLERVLPNLDRLQVWVPEKHDLALMKPMRAYEHDLQAIEEIHAHSPLDLDTLVGRFQDEMTPIGDPARIRANVLAVVERLFPDRVEDVMRRLRKALP